MPALFFDTATLRPTGIRAGGKEQTFAQLGSAVGTLTVFARELTVEGVPDRSRINLAADRLIVTNPSAFQFPDSGNRRVNVAAQRIEGPVSIVCRGRAGATGAPGPNGKPTKFIMVVADPSNPEIREPRLVSLPTAGGPGGVGGPGERGGTVRLWYTTSLQSPSVAAPGGKGGAGGAGGIGGAGHEDLGVPKAPNGGKGNPGAPGQQGLAESRLFSTAGEMWARWAKELAPTGTPAAWAAYRLRVAEHLYRLGAPGDITAAEAHLATLVTRPGVETIVTRARRLLQQIFEHMTYGGLPRDLDVTPDVSFAAQDNDKLAQAALQLIGHAQTIVSAAEIKDDFAQFADLSADHGTNLLEPAATRKELAAESLKTAMKGTDIARGRVKNIDKKISELREVIKQEHAANSGPFALMTDIIGMGINIAQVAVGVSTGIGAIVQVGRGFAALNKAGEKSKNLFDLVDDVKKKLKEDPSMKAFKTGIKDLKNADKTISHIGELVKDLDSIGSTHPDPRIRELAVLQREQILLNQEVGLHTQMEKEAQLGISAANADHQAITSNIALSRDLARRLREGALPAAKEVVEPLLVSIRQVLDALSHNLFVTIRAKEIYLALDPDAVVRYDLGQIHPDREQMLTLGARLSEILNPIAARLTQIIKWSSLVDEMTKSGDLSRSPISFFFATENPQLLDPLRATGNVAFQVPVEDLFAEDGSQLFEAKLDSVTIRLHGASIPTGGGQSIKLRQVGHWSVRRRPEATAPNGTVKDFAFPGREAHLTCSNVAGGVEARLTAPANPGAQPPFDIWGRGVAGDWELTDIGGIDFSGVTAIEVGFHAQALSKGTLAARRRAAARQLRVLPGWPAPPAPTRPPTPVPPRGVVPYSYAYGTGLGIGVGSVAAVGAALV